MKRALSFLLLTALSCACNLTAADVSGHWIGQMNAESGVGMELPILMLERHNEKFAGSITFTWNSAPVPIEEVELRGDQLSFEALDRAKHVGYAFHLTATSGEYPNLTGWATAKDQRFRVNISKVTSSRVFRSSDPEHTRLISMVEPEYPGDAPRSAKIEGIVVVYAAISKEGKVSPRSVLHSIGFGYSFDRKAIEAVAKWRFEPGMRNGEPIDTEAQLAVNFLLPAVPTVQDTNLPPTGNPEPASAFAGIWVEKNPTSGPPMRLKLAPRGSQIEVYLSYTASWGSRPFGVATIQNDNATWTEIQTCGEMHRKPGYNYDHPGDNFWNLSIRRPIADSALGPILFYTQETRMYVPCGGSIGTQRIVKVLERETTASALDGDSFQIISAGPPIETKLHQAPVEFHARIRYTLTSMDSAVLSIGSERFWGTNQGCIDPAAQHHTEGGTTVLLKKGSGEVDVAFRWLGDVPSYSTVPKDVTTFVGLGGRFWPEENGAPVPPAQPYNGSRSFPASFSRYSPVRSSHSSLTG
jgi:TonB family protein